MSTNKTPNLSLHSWEATDTFSRTEINENFTAIDAAVGGLDTAMAANALAATAAQSAADAAQATANAALAAANAAAEAHGNTRLIWGTYVGDGKAGTGNYCTLTFESRPLYIMIHPANNATDHLILRQGQYPGTGSFDNGATCIGATWKGNTVQWVGNTAAAQFNTLNYKYYYTALLGD